MRGFNRNLKHSLSVYYESQYTNIIYTHLIKMSNGRNKKMKKENEEIIEKILKKCNSHEKVVIKENRNLILKIYHSTRKDVVNQIL